MPTQRQQRRTARLNQDMRALDDRIAELEAENRKLEQTVTERTERADVLRQHLNNMLAPPVAHIRGLVQKMLFVPACDMNITGEMAAISQWLKEHDEFNGPQLPSATGRVQ